MFKNIFLVCLFVFTSVTLFANQEIKMMTGICDVQSKQILDETTLSVFDWFSSSEPKDEMGDLIKKTRDTAKNYFDASCAEGEIAIGTVYAPCVTLSPGHKFQMVIISVYDGVQFSEGLSQACCSSEKYELKDETWEEMKEKALDMVKISYHMTSKKS